MNLAKSFIGVIIGILILLFLAIAVFSFLEQFKATQEPNSTAYSVVEKGIESANIVFFGIPLPDETPWIVLCLLVSSGGVLLWQYKKNKYTF